MIAGVVVGMALALVSAPAAASISAVGLTVIPLFAAAQAFRASRHREGRTKTAWILLGISGIVWASGSISWTATSDAGGAPEGSLAAALYLLSYPVAIAGLITFAPGEGRRSALVRLFDGLVIGASALAVSWALVLHDVWHLGGANVSQRVFSMSYAIGDAIMVALLIFLVMRRGAPDRIALGILGIGLAVLAITDNIFTWITLTTGYTMGHWVDGGYMAGFAITSLAAIHVGRTAAESPTKTEGTLRYHLPYVAAAIAFVVSIVSQTVHRDLDLVSLVVLLTMCSLVIVRQFLVMMDQQAQTIAQLRSVDEMKNGILRAVSHELRTPLTFIKGSAAFLVEDGDSLDPQMRQELHERLLRNSDRLESLVVGLLDLERLTRGVIEPDRQETDVTRLVLNVAENISTPDHDLRIVGSSLDAQVDPRQVERIVENLLINATRHTPPGTVVTARVGRTSEGVLIQVEDDGPGIPAHERKRIFRPFVQMIDSGRGTGIGLSLVAKFAEVHGGRAWVDDAPSGGARFHVLLPDAPQDEDGGSPVAAAPRPHRASVA